jgi:hypothetical protein
VIAPAYPGLEVEVEALNADPSPIEALTVPRSSSTSRRRRRARAPPILIGHSAGGVFTQILLDHGFGAAGVAINSAPTEGVKRVPLSQVKATFPVLKNPANRHRAVGFTLEQWHYAFTNASARRSRARSTSATTSPRPGRSSGAARSRTSTRQGRHWVDYDNDDRAPLLFISGSETTSCRRRSSSPTRSTTSRHRSPRSRSSRARTCCPPAGLGAGRRLRARLGAERHAGQPSRRVKAHPHRRPDGPDRGRRLAPAHRPDVRSRPAAATASAGGRVAQARRPGDRRRRPRPIDAVLLSHDHHDDNLDPAGRALLPSRGHGGHDRAGRERLGGDARGLAPWATHALDAPGRPSIEVTRDAVPARAAAAAGRSSAT